jgi:glycosyltransferase involved in cell wall biosynthesis
MGKPIHIAVDVRWIGTDTGGIKQYTVNLVKNLAKIDRKNRYSLLYNSDICRKELEKDLELNPNFKWIKFRYGIFSLQNQIFLPGFLKKNKIDVFHSTNFMVPLYCNMYKTVVTVHDLKPYLFPDLCRESKKVKFYHIYKVLMKNITRKVNKIITVSQYSKSDILNVFHINSSKVQVVYNGKDDIFRVIDDRNLINETKLKYKIPQNRIILYVGRHEFAKNLVGLINAFAKLEKKLSDAYLVITGEKDERYPEPYLLIDKLSLNKKVIFTGFLPDVDLPLIYSSCDIFVFPSFYEGFGLPPLEAMACGIPVITSDTSSLPEIVGDAGIMINPCDIDGLADNMYKVLTDNNLRLKMIEKGLGQAGVFSWKEAAKKTIEVYEKVVGE